MYRLALLAIVVLVSLPIVNAETRTFNDCYKDMAASLFMYAYFNPNADINTLMEPKTKPFISYVCDFYHDKTGIWANASDVNIIKEKYAVEFEQGLKTIIVP